MLKWQRILCPLDFSDTSRGALDAATDIARRFDAELTLLHVYPVPGYLIAEGFVPASPEVVQSVVTQVAESLAQWKKQVEDPGPLRVQTMSEMGVPFEEIVRVAKEGHYDLIVMGTHGRTGLKHVFIGSVAERVVRKAPCAVLTVRPAPPGG